MDSDDWEPLRSPSQIPADEQIAMAARARDIARALEDAGLPVWLATWSSPPPDEPCVELSVDTMTDSGRGIYLEWRTGRAVVDAVVKSMEDGRFDDPVIRESAELKQAGAERIVAALEHAGVRAEDPNDDYMPYAVKVIDEADSARRMSPERTAALEARADEIAKIVEEAGLVLRRRHWGSGTSWSMPGDGPGVELAAYLFHDEACGIYVRWWAGDALEDAARDATRSGRLDDPRIGERDEQCRAGRDRLVAALGAAGVPAEPDDEVLHPFGMKILDEPDDG